MPASPTLAQQVPASPQCSSAAPLEWLRSRQAGSSAPLLVRSSQLDCSSGRNSIPPARSRTANFSTAPARTPRPRRLGKIDQLRHSAAASLGPHWPLSLSLWWPTRLAALHSIQLRPIADCPALAMQVGAALHRGPLCIASCPKRRISKRSPHTVCLRAARKFAGPFCHAPSFSKGAWQ